MSARATRGSMEILVWLEWPERCFRADARSMRLLKSLVPAGARVRRVRFEAEFVRALAHATHVVTWHFRREWYALSPRLKLVATPAAGREFVSCDAPEGVRVHFGGFHGAIISESVVAFLLAWCRGFLGSFPSAWPRVWLSERCRTLAGTRAVIVGYGRIGRAIGEKLMRLGVQVTGITRHPPTDLASSRNCLKTADWLILALPGDTGTDRFLDARLICRLPRRCVVVNVGRGNAVDEQALVGALESGRLAGAYLDVIRNEPVPAWSQALCSPPKGDAVRAVDPPLCARKVENLFVMPHASAFSPDYIGLCFKELRDEGLI